MSAPSDVLFASSARRFAALSEDIPLGAGCSSDSVLAPSALLVLATATQAAAPMAPPADAPQVKINPTKRTLRFVVPLTDNGTYLGDVDLAVDPEDRLSVRAERLLQILGPLLQQDVFERLQRSSEGFPEIGESLLAAEHITLRYDNENLALAIDIPVLARRTNALSLRDMGFERAESLEPASFSAYLNLRTAIDVVEQGRDPGVTPPLSIIDGAVRVGGVVAEGEGYLSLRDGDRTFRRTGSRIVYDDVADVIRISAGDLQPLGRAFQATPTVAGLSVARLYNVLQPGRELRSTGAQSFTLFAPSTVETIVNGRSVERRVLQPGSYDLSDFPLAEGANRVKLLIEDQTGQQRTVEFNAYSNFELLQPGATEFFAFAGVYSRPTTAGIEYSGQWNASGFIRRGLTQQITAGVNVQANAGSQQAGLELLLGTSAGLIGVDLAASTRSGGAAGFAGAATIEKIIETGPSGRSQSLRASLEYRSPRFAVPGALIGREPAAVRASLGYGLTLGADTFVAFDAQYNRDRVEDRDGYSVRAFGGFKVRDAISAFGEIGVEHTREDTGPVARIGLRMRLGPRATAQADVDTRGNVRSVYQTSGGRGIGTWAASADMARTPEGTTLNANASLLTNRAELSVNQSALYDAARSGVKDVTTSIRVATSFAFADGAFAVGRPVQDAFLIAGPHRSLKGRQVLIDPQGRSASATSGRLGKALEGSLTSYSPRLLVYDVPGAPAGYDLGSGNVQLAPPYKAGYKLEVGSDYHLLVIGRLLDRNGQPISLLAGQAFEVAAPKRPAVTMFTSRGGKFGALGLRAGRWRIEMPTEGTPTVFEFEVADDPSGSVRVGDLHPVNQEGER